MSLTVEASRALRDAEVVFICVGIPARADGEANLLAVERAASALTARRNGCGREVDRVPAGTANRVEMTVFHPGSEPPR